MGYKSKEKQRRYQRDWMRRRRESWLEANGPCVDCGAAEQLEVDHVDPATKVSHHVWSWSDERRDHELSKCVVRCHDCHARRSRVQALGERNHFSKLTRREVIAIHALGRRGETHQAIADRFDIHRGTVGKILRGERWPHMRIAS